MMSKIINTIQFDVLIRANSDEATPHVSNIESFKPAQGDIDKCLHWFKKQGLSVYPTNFGLAGHATRKQFESVFRIRLISTPDGSTNTPYAMSGSPYLPDEIKPLIDQITVVRPPEMF